MFDAARYDREVLRPLRGAHGRLPPGDLPARYAVDPAMDAAELTAHLAVIRAWWEQRAQAPDFRAEVCRLLLQADAELRATAGDAMKDPAWWQEQERAGPETVLPDTAERIVAPPAEVAGMHAEHDWRAEARAEFWTALARLERAPAPAGPPRAAPATVAPVPTGAPAEHLHATPVTADGDRCEVELSWPADAFSGVRIRYASEAPPFPAETLVPWSRAEQWGTEIPGTPVHRDGRLVLTAVVPTGYHVYLPLAPDSGQARTGRLIALGVADPVQRLQTRRHGHGTIVTWVWPSDATTVHLEWTTPATTERHAVTRARYTAARGHLLPDTRTGGMVRVHALTPVGPGVARSPAATAVVSPAATEVHYQLQRRRRFGGSELVLSVTADRDCTELEVDVVVSTGEFLPLAAGEGASLRRLGPLVLVSGTPDRHVLPWPEVPRHHRPFWIRCFAQAPYPVSFVDPPIEQMRIA
ncbi:hypothetical protein [Actinoplanes sp. NBRC 101535]|uniref:hypothetical protein n=1 Tax=Actinoplanes sp. NBRC 101535 TaxID=3032196 RepID=UPI0024A17F13|nr:hypothetical protein [Actinoplanes sp. NBRC 101535]GLY04328.1 hypothetical protein Acsp01_47070 [Actinoplanes sp. NBRC 101535]